MAIDPPALANLSAGACMFLSAIGITDYNESPETAALIWLHAMATGYAPEYLEENADGLVVGWPRIPLPAKAEVFRSSAALGQQIAALLDPTAAVAGVSFEPRPEMAVLGLAELKPVVGRPGPVLEESRHYQLNANWGYKDARGAVMPGTGRAVLREYRKYELEAFEEGASGLGLPVVMLIELIGAKCYDIDLNTEAHWQCVPEKVWNYYIGGYQVIKKWLSYREFSILGRALKPSEVEEVQQMVRRIAAILLLGPQLDAVYQQASTDYYPWPG